MCTSTTAWEQRRNSGLIFNQSVIPTSYDDGLPLLAAIILGRVQKLREFCFCTLRQDMTKYVAQLHDGIEKPSDLVEVVDNLCRLADSADPPAPVLDRHVKAVYRILLQLVIAGDSPAQLEVLEVEMTETFHQS